MTELLTRRLAASLTDLVEHAETVDPRQVKIAASICEQLGLVVDASELRQAWFRDGDSARLGLVAAKLLLVCGTATIPSPKADGPRPVKGSRKGAPEKIIGALAAHHEYESAGGGSCLKCDPMRVGDLANKAAVSSGSVSNFFKNQFGENGHSAYVNLCSSAARLARWIGKCNGESPRHELWNGANHDLPDAKTCSAAERDALGLVG